MTNLKRLSDLELNRLAAKYQGGLRGDCGSWLKDGVKVQELPVFYTERSYCLRWQDAGKLLEESNISLVYMGGDWEAHFLSPTLGDEAHNMSHSNPLRAIVLCYVSIMMEAEK